MRELHLFGVSTKQAKRVMEARGTRCSDCGAEAVVVMLVSNDSPENVLGAAACAEHRTGVDANVARLTSYADGVRTERVTVTRLDAVITQAHP